MTDTPRPADPRTDPLDRRDSAEPPGQLGCPVCWVPLRPVRPQRGPHSFACPSCAGRLVTVEALHPYVEPARLVALWGAARAGGVGDGKTCPGCGRPMRTIRTEGAGQPLELDACPACRLLWFDATELGRLAPPADLETLRRGREAAEAERRRNLPPEAVAMLARAELAHLDQMTRTDFLEEVVDLLPHDDLSWIPDLLASWALPDKGGPATAWSRLAGIFRSAAARFGKPSGRRGGPERG
jgi:Zn-finger nucleic acid-binding protein